MKHNRARLLLANLINVKDKRIYGYLVKAYNSPGVLGGICDVLASRNLNVIFVGFNDSGWGDLGTIFVAVDFQHSTLDPENVGLEIEKLDKVVEVEVVKPQVKNVLVDTYHFPIVNLENSRCIVLDEASIEMYVLKLREKFQVVGSSLLYHQGLLVGGSLKSKFEMLGANKLKDAIDLLILRSIALGRYRGLLTRYPRDGDLTLGPITIRMYDNWECEFSKKHGLREASSHFERGVIAGLIQAYTNRDVRAVEDKCIALGDRYCEIVVEGKS